MKSEDYQPLIDILERAYQRAASEKGKERHARNRPFMEQPIIYINKAVHGGFCAGQAMKKIEESFTLDKDKAITELLDSIVYISGEIIYLENEETNSKKLQKRASKGRKNSSSRRKA